MKPPSVRIFGGICRIWSFSQPMWHEQFYGLSFSQSLDEDNMLTLLKKHSRHILIFTVSIAYTQYPTQCTWIQDSLIFCRQISRPIVILQDGQGHIFNRLICKFIYAFPRYFFLQLQR